MKSYKINTFLDNNRFRIATICVFLLFGTLIIMSITSKTINYGTLITISAALATIYFGLIKYWIDEDLIFKSLFESFNKRFDSLNKDLNAIVSNKKPDVRTEDEIAQDYLNLCAEEYYWHKKGRIPKIVWYSWLNGINYYLSSDKIKAYFKNQLEWDKSYYGFLNSIIKKLK
jgi:hypothetical protein